MSGYAGAWHMLTAVRRGNTVVVYIDGKEAGKGNADFIAAGGEETLYIGRLVEGGFDFRGKLTGVGLLETAPDDAEMVKMYRAHVQEVAPGRHNPFYGKPADHDRKHRGKPGIGNR